MFSGSDFTNINVLCFSSANVLNQISLGFVLMVKYASGGKYMHCLRFSSLFLDKIKMYEVIMANP